jgi:hypothetical protein
VGQSCTETLFAPKRDLKSSKQSSIGTMNAQPEWLSPATIYPHNDIPRTTQLPEEPGPESPSSVGVSKAGRWVITQGSWCQDLSDMK